MRRLLLTLILLGLGLPSPALAQVCPGASTPLRPYAKETLVISSTALPLTNSVYMSAGNSPKVASVTLTGDSISYWDTGDVPTASVGHLVPLVGSAVQFLVCGQVAVQNFKAIRVTTDATLAVSYYK